MAGKLTMVLGAQYGSEGKGVIVASMADEYGMHVRVGSPNAGHTFRWQGEKHVMQSIPCGWINPKANIVLGRGSLINMDLLMKELEHIEKYYPDFRCRLFIDAKAGILSKRFHLKEGGVDGELHARIGSTGEGVGEARIARLKRDKEQFSLFEDVCKDYGLEECIYYNTVKLIDDELNSNGDVLIEGTQGSALSLLHSYYPYCTSIDTNASGVLSEVGIPPFKVTNIILVARTYPIRVAGNSGYMKNEIDWDILSERLGKEVIEKTTVTKKVRRIAEWDEDLIWDAILYNAPTSFAITFTDYLDPSIAGVEYVDDLMKSEIVSNFIAQFENTFATPVSMVGTGGKDFSVVRLKEEI